MSFRPLWAWRLLLLTFAIVYLASDDLQVWLPPLLPFAAAAAVEAQFFFSGVRARRRRRVFADPGPQQRDLDELGWKAHTVTVRQGDAELVLRPGELDSEEVAEWLEAHRVELAELGPGHHELAAIDNAASPVALHVEPVRQRAGNRTRTRLVQALAVLALFAGLFFLDSRGEHWQHLSTSARAATVEVLDRQAARIAGHPADVICDVAGRHVGYVQDADGLAVVGGRRAWLTPQICYQLYLIHHRGRANGPASGHAIAVLAHEAWHLNGESSEALANCYAYQSGVGVGEALGLSPSTARQLMREQLADNPSDFADTPQYVVPSGCTQGGSFDLHLDGSHFP
jgi:hypothetical protein